MLLFTLHFLNFKFCTLQISNDLPNCLNITINIPNNTTYLALSYPTCPLNLLNPPFLVKTHSKAFLFPICVTFEVPRDVKTSIVELCQCVNWAWLLQWWHLLSMESYNQDKPLANDPSWCDEVWSSNCWWFSLQNSFDDSYYKILMIPIAKFSLKSTRLHYSCFCFQPPWQFPTLFLAINLTKQLLMKISNWLNNFNLNLCEKDWVNIF